jgi:hypothetical protein
MNEFMAILFIVIVLFLWMSENRPPIPKKVWSFNAGPVKSLGSDSISLTDNNRIVLTKKTYKGYVTIPEEIAGHPVFTIDDKRFHDLVCLWTLAEHGGKWITTMPDASSMHNEHGGKWIQDGIKNPLLEYDSNKEFHGYYSKTGIDTRYMECIKGSAFICAWRDEYSRIAEFPSVERYLQSRSVGLQKFIGDDFVSDPMMVACKLILPQHLKRIELRAMD